MGWKASRWRNFKRELYLHATEPILVVQLLDCLGVLVVEFYVGDEGLEGGWLSCVER